MRKWSLSVIIVVVGVFLVGPAAFAQTSSVAADKQSHWGVTGTFVPTWKVPKEFKIIFDADKANIEGSEFEVGFVRGRDLGGDWGLSFVKKNFKVGSVVERGFTELQCFGQDGCIQSGTRYTTRDVSLMGLEIHKFVVFGTISRRVQIGMNFAGGVASVKGQAEKYEAYPQWFISGPRGYTISQGSQRSDAEGRELFVSDLKTVPLLKVQLGVTGILMPGLKVKVLGGLNFPGYSIIGVSAVYLFGAR